MTATRKTARHIHIPVEQARDIHRRLKLITFGDCLSMSESAFDLLREAIQLLDTGLKYHDEKSS